MDRIDKRQSQKAFALNVLGSLGAVLAINALIFGLGWNKGAAPASPGLFLPVIPGWLIGIVWTCLFALLGAARWRVTVLGGRADPSARSWLIGLLAFCSAYPLYTVGLSNDIIGFAGNIATIIVAAIVFNKLRRFDVAAALAPAGVVAWVCFASIYLADQQRWWW